MSVEVLGPVIVALWLVTMIWRVPWIVETIKQEQREEPFGSKRWHWPAAALLGVSFLMLMLLRLVTDSG